MKLALLFLVSAVSIPALAACSAGSGPPIGLTGSSRSGVNAGYSINALSDFDRGRMCDWVAQNNGGYGGSLAPVRCEQGYTVSKKAPKNQAECIEDLQKVPPACRVTVGEVEDCLTYLYDNPCTTVKNPPQCAGLLDESCTQKKTTVVVEQGGSSTSGSSSTSTPQE